MHDKIRHIISHQPSTKSNLPSLTVPSVGILGTIPTLTLAYLTAPFVHQVFLQIPEYARRSRNDLIHFARTLETQPKQTANTKLEFVTLRIFPFRKTTAVFLHELRALPPRKMRLANIELPKTDAWVERQRAKGIFKRMYEVASEPRFKFYIKEGRLYTMKTGVPGMWEAIAQRIRDQTNEETLRPGGTKTKTAESARPVVRAQIAAAKPTVKRQTSRPIHCRPR